MTMITKLLTLLIAKRKQSDPYRSIKIERARKEFFASIRQN